MPKKKIIDSGIGIKTNLNESLAKSVNTRLNSNVLKFSTLCFEISVWKGISWSGWIWLRTWVERVGVGFSVCCKGLT